MLHGERQLETLRPITFRCTRQNMRIRFKVEDMGARVTCQYQIWSDEGMSWWIISGHKLAMASDAKHSSFNDDRVSMGPQPNSILHDPTTTSSAGIFAVRGISRHIPASRIRDLIHVQETGWHFEKLLRLMIPVGDCTYVARFNHDSNDSIMITAQKNTRNDAVTQSGRPPAVHPFESSDHHPRTGPGGSNGTHPMQQPIERINGVDMSVTCFTIFGRTLAAPLFSQTSEAHLWLCHPKPGTEERQNTWFYARLARALHLDSHANFSGWSEPYSSWLHATLRRACYSKCRWPTILILASGEIMGTWHTGLPSGKFIMALKKSHLPIGVYIYVCGVYAYII